MNLKISFICLLLFSNLLLIGQNGVIKGRVYNQYTNEPIPFANVSLQGTTVGAVSNMDGIYEIRSLSPGMYNIESSFVGFNKKTVFEVQVSNSKSTTVDFPLEEAATTLQAVEITASPFVKKEESPLSMRTLNVAEIQRTPGGNRDISKVIQSLPGVASSVSFRNDIIIRGGAPNENRFYLDGVEVPNINHFATQGSSGGPVGMLNVNFIREVDFYSGAFPSNRGNALSSVFDFKQIDGNEERLNTTFMVGSSDIGLTFDGPLSKKTTFVLSARRSYLQFLFQALKLPFLPTYNDFQFKVKHKFNEKNQITFLGLGAIDDFILNEKVNDGVTDASLIERNNYILGNLPINTQWNYTLGANYQRFNKNGFSNLVVSRNHLSNNTIKYANNDDSLEDNLILDYSSQEIEQKTRFENNLRINNLKINYGAGFDWVTYTNSTFRKVVFNNQSQVIDFSSRLDFRKYALFAQLSKGFLQERLMLSLGLRTDFNDYATSMLNPIRQLSPRLSASYQLTDKWSLNFNTGRYFQLPAYTILGYKDPMLGFVNKDNDLRYISVDHLVGGVEYTPLNTMKVTVEGFFKNYNYYPFSVNDSLSLANLGADFGVIGNEEVVSNSKGRSYGLEFLLQQKLYKGFYGILAYTFVRSEFQDKRDVYIPSAWDNRNIISATAGKKFWKTWEFGMRFRFSGGTPYTPYDVEKSSLTYVWDITNQGLPDFDRLNAERLPVTHGLDIRLDKKFYFKKWSLNLYLDIQNLYNYKTVLPDYLYVEKDANGNSLINPSDPMRYQVKYLPNQTGTVLPSIGLMMEF